MELGGGASREGDDDVIHADVTPTFKSMVFEFQSIVWPQNNLIKYHIIMMLSFFLCIPYDSNMYLVGVID